MRVFEDRVEAEGLLAPGEVLCSTLAKDGKPLYFLCLVSDSDDVVQARAFEAREGRSLSQFEADVLVHANLRAARHGKGGV